MLALSEKCGGKKIYKHGHSLITIKREMVRNMSIILACLLIQLICLIIANSTRVTQKLKRDSVTCISL